MRTSLLVIALLLVAPGVQAHGHGGGHSHHHGGHNHPFGGGGLHFVFPGANHHSHAVGSSGYSLSTNGGALGTFGRSGPAIDAKGHVVSLRPLPNEGHSPEIENALRAHSSEWRYRGELCGMLSTWSEQRTCLRQFMRR